MLLKTFPGRPSNGRTLNQGSSAPLHVVPERELLRSRLEGHGRSLPQNILVSSFRPVGLICSGIIRHVRLYPRKYQVTATRLYRSVVMMCLLFRPWRPVVGCCINIPAQKDRVPTEESGVEQIRLPFEFALAFVEDVSTTNSQPTTLSPLKWNEDAKLTRYPQPVTRHP